MSRYTLETLAVITGLVIAFALSQYSDGTWVPVH